MSPRKPSAGQPLTITDQTCLPLLGIEWRTLRTWLAQHGVRVVKIGRRSVFRADKYLDALDHAAGATPRPHWDEAAFLAELDGDIEAAILRSTRKAAAR